MWEEFLKPIGEILVTTSKQEWFQVSVGSALLIFLCAMFFFIIKRIKRGDEFKFLWMIEIKPNDIIKKHEEAFTNLNQDALQKSQVLKILNNANKEVSKLLVCETYEEFENIRKFVYDSLLYGIAVVLTKSKSANHRIAIFISEDGSSLRIHEGLGYSSEGKANLRLDVGNSAAGKVFRTGEPYISGDITSEGNVFKKHPKSTKTYHSLMCVPIMCDKMVLGVLSIDGQEKDSFSKDDLDYLGYFADALSSLMFIENKLNEEDEEHDEDQSEPQGQPA